MAKPAKLKSRKFRATRHAFRFRIRLPSGEERTFTKWAEVVRAKGPVDIKLIEQHLLHSMKMKGMGNTALCTGSVCTQAHKDKFPHPITGYTDWLPSTCFVVSKDDADGFPAICVQYEHNEDFWKLNDTKAGQQKLLRRLREGGPITIRLRVPRHQKFKPASYPGSNTGEKKRFQPRGANLRFAVAQAGLMSA